MKPKLISPPEDLRFLMVEFNYFFELGMKAQEEKAYVEAINCRKICKKLDKTINEKLNEL